MRKENLTEYQRSTDSLRTNKVQLWSDGIMMCVIPLEEAREYIKAGTHFVITDQAIERIENSSKGQANIFGIVGLAYLVFMLVVLLTIF